MSQTSEGKICYELKTPYRDGATNLIFEPLDFISKLAALIPSPRVNPTRFHGVFAPNSQYRAMITKKANIKISKAETKTENEKRRGMLWAARLKRAFNIDIKTCERCGGAVKVIACIDDLNVINKILEHLKTQEDNQFKLPISRAPPLSLVI